MPNRDKRDFDPTLRATLIAAAFDILDAEDAGRVTVRAAARRAGVGLAGAARCFGNREKLLTALAAQSLRDLADALEAATPAGSAPRLARLRAAGGAAHAYAERTPHRYALCWRVNEVDCEDPAWLAASELLCARLRGVMETAQPSPLNSILTAGSLLHGFVQLRRSGALGPGWSAKPA